MLKRNDVHRPSVIDPDEYRFVSFHSHRGEDVFAAMAEADNFRRDMASTGGKTAAAPFPEAELPADPLARLDRAFCQ